MTFKWPHNLSTLDDDMSHIVLLNKTDNQLINTTNMGFMEWKYIYLGKIGKKWGIWPWCDLDPWTLNATETFSIEDVFIQIWNILWYNIGFFLWNPTHYQENKHDLLKFSQTFDQVTLTFWPLSDLTIYLCCLLAWLM